MVFTVSSLIMFYKILVKRVKFCLLSRKKVDHPFLHSLHYTDLENPLEPFPEGSDGGEGTLGTLSSPPSCYL